MVVLSLLFKPVAHAWKKQNEKALSMDKEKGI